MGERNHKSIAAVQNCANDDLDRVLDAALAKYAAVEPRTGLEDRILANLRAERMPIPDHGWWKWSLAAAAILVVVAVVLASRLDRPSRPAIANHPPTAIPQQQQRGTTIANGNPNLGQSKAAPHRAGEHPTQANAAAAANPKLDLFPSPQPLSEQEKILAGYVSDYPEHAAVIAQARMNALRQDEAEKMRESAAGSQDLGR